MAKPEGDEKGIIRNPSKKIIVGFAGFVGIGVALVTAVHYGAHLYVQLVLALGMVSIPPSLIFGLAWMDAIVRAVKAWRGTNGTAAPARAQAPVDEEP